MSEKTESFILKLIVFLVCWIPAISPGTSIGEVTICGILGLIVYQLIDANFVLKRIEKLLKEKE